MYSDSRGNMQFIDAVYSNSRVFGCVPEMTAAFSAQARGPVHPYSVIPAQFRARLTHLYIIMLGNTV